MTDQIPLFEIAWDERDVSNAVESIARGGYWAKGPFVDRFEDGLESYFGVEHAVVVNSGTTALVAALRAAKIGQGDEVIVPSFTFVATANAVRLVGAEPVFADVEQETYGLDPQHVRKRLTERTAGIIPVHLYGDPCRIDEIVEIARDEDLVVVEDAAEAFGSTYGGAPVGTFGKAGAFSFCQNKIVVTGEGGAVVTDDDDLARDLRLFRSHGRASGGYFERADSGEYVALGTNARMSDLTAAIGCAQLDKVDELIGGRRQAANELSAALADIDGVQTPEPIEGGTHVYQLYTVELGDGIDRETVVETLADRGIGSKIYWDTPVHDYEYYRRRLDGPAPSLPVTAELVDSVLSLPMYPDLSTAAVDRIVDAFAAAVEKAR